MPSALPLASYHHPPHTSQTTASAMDDQPAMGEDGKLRDASEMQWFNSPTDEHKALPDVSQSISLDSDKEAEGPADSQEGKRKLPSQPAREQSGGQAKGRHGANAVRGRGGRGRGRGGKNLAIERVKSGSASMSLHDSSFYLSMA